MAWLGLQMISLCPLLILLNHRAAGGSARCVGAEQLRSLEQRFRGVYWDKRSVNPQPQQERTCADAAKNAQDDTSGRSLSPWRYSLNRDDNRFPRDIAFAECLCQGCIINQRENFSYNSVPVFAWLMVLQKAPCRRDPNKYVVRKDFIRVPVACTCAGPKYTKQA